MKYCKECGEKLTDNQSVCPICGTAVTNTEVVSHGDATVLETSSQSTQKKKSNKKIILFVAACVLLIGIVFLVLFLTGVFSKCKPDETSQASEQREIDPEVSETPSKERLVRLEKKYLTDLRDTVVSRISEFQALSFDADVTLAAENTSGSGGLSTADFLNNAKLQLQMENSNGKNIGVSFLLWNNPIIDLRAFDLGQEKISIYSSARADKLYVVSLDKVLQTLLGDQSFQANGIVSMIQTLLVDSNAEKLKPETDLLIDGLMNSILANDVQIKENESVLLSDGEQEVTCELYTVTLTKEQIELFLNLVLDEVENGNGFIADSIRRAGIGPDEISNARNNIPDTAQRAIDSGLRFEIAVSGNSIVRQSVINNSMTLVWDTFTTDAGKNTFLSLQTDGKPHTIVMKENHEGLVDLRADIRDVAISGSFDKNRKSLIGTYAGTFEVSVNGRKIAAIEIFPSDQGMMHSVTLDESVLANLPIDGDITLRIEVKSATGVQRPNGAETEDISDYSAEKLLEVLRGLIGPIDTLVNMGSGN